MTGSRSEENDVPFRFDPGGSFLAGWTHRFPFSSRPLKPDGLVDLISEALTSNPDFFRPTHMSFGVERLPRTEPVRGTSHPTVSGDPFLSVRTITERLRMGLQQEPEDGEATVVSVHLWGSCRVYLPADGELEEGSYGFISTVTHSWLNELPQEDRRSFFRLHLMCEHYAESYGYTPNYDCGILSPTDFWFVFRLPKTPMRWRVASLRSAVVLAQFMSAWRTVKGYGFSDHELNGSHTEYPGGKDPTTPLGALTEGELEILSSIPEAAFTPSNPTIRSVLDTQAQS